MKHPPKHVRLDPDVQEEVQKIAELTGLPQLEIIRQMVGAGVRAIRDNNYKLTLPLALKVVEGTNVDPEKLLRVSKQGVGKIKAQRKNGPSKSASAEKSASESQHPSAPHKDPQAHSKS